MLRFIFLSTLTVRRSKISKNYSQRRKSGWNSGGRKVDPEGLVGVGCGYPFPPGKRCGEELCPLPRKKKIFSLEMACFGALWAVRFVRVHMLNFPPEVVIWWTLKMYFWGKSEYSVRIMGLISFLLHYCIEMKAIWCFKFWNMKKYGGQFALASPTLISGGLVPPAPRD